MGRKKAEVKVDEKVTKDTVSSETVVTKERAVISKERRLALALVAVMDGVLEGGDVLSSAAVRATALLNELGYGDLESIPKRVARLTEELNAALSNADYASVARLGLELEKAKIGAKVRSNGSATVGE